MADKVQIQIQFTKEDKGLRFTDALYMSQAEYANIKPADLEKMKQDRFDSWLYLIQNPPVVPEPTDEVKLEEVTLQYEHIKQEKESLEERVLTSDAKLAQIDEQLTELALKRTVVEGTVVNKPIKNTVINFHKENR